MAQAVSHWPLTAFGAVHVGFVVDRAALGQAILRVLRFTRQYHSTMAPILAYHLANA
jgi:hypothetical protein